ncbi:MAG: hypothetical protein KGI39_00695 [Patescibacteria group bacterium]|nr:hypothetical protein [Patescibacteria group bacterium]
MNKKNKKILFIPAQGFAHVTRTLRLAEAFKQDYDTQIILTKEFIMLADNLGMNYKLIDIKKMDYQQIIKGNFDGLSDEVKVAKEAKLYDQIIMDFMPDVVITSACMTATIPIRKHGINHISITDSCNVEELKYGGNFASDKVVMIKDKILSPYNSVASGFGLPPVENFIDLIGGSFNVMPDLPYLFPLRENLPNFKFIGPLTWQDESGHLDSRIKIDRTSPLIYVSMGSSGKTEDMEQIAKILHHSPYQAVMTTGSVADSDALKKFEREGFYIEKFISGNKIIKASDKTIVVCHAGLGTMYQALENKVYGMVTIPAHMQHFLISKRFAELGIASELKGDSINRLLDVCADIISRPQAEGYKRINAELRMYEGQRNGKAEIEAYLEK